MKNSLMPLLITGTLLFLVYACPDKDVEPDSVITIVNDSPDSLLFWIGYRNDTDTLLTRKSLFPDEETRNSFLVLPESTIKEKGAFIWALNYNKNHFLMLFLFSLGDVEMHPWDTISINYMVKRRYDLTKEDLDSLDWTITYP
jgi:hypothetical protein